MLEMDINSIEFFESEDGMGPAKATVHKSGKLGFSRAANKLIDFDANKFFKIGRKKAENGDKSDILYLIPVAEKDEFAFTIIKAGGYYSLKTKRLLNQLGIDYRNEDSSVIFDIDEVRDKERTYFKLTARKGKGNLPEDTE
jgi:hypothetical protein